MGSGGLGFPNSQGWVAYRIPFLSSPPLSPVPVHLPSYSPPPSGGKARDRSPFREGSHRVGSSHSGLLQSGICCDEGFEFLEADYRSFMPQQASSVFQVSDGDTTVGSPVYQDWGLDGFYRSAGSCSSGLPQIPPVCNGRSGLPVSGSLFL